MLWRFFKPGDRFFHQQFCFGARDEHFIGNVEIKPEEFPVTEDAWMKIGLSQLKMGYYEAAFEIFGKLLEIKPEAADIWYVAGLALRGLDQDEQAIEFFEWAVELDSALEAAWDQMGLTLLGVGRYEEACQAFSSVLTLNPENVNAL